MAEESEVGRAQEQDGGNPAALICHPRTPYRSPFPLRRPMRPSSGVSAVAFAPLEGTADSSLLSLPLCLLLVLFFLLLVLAHVVDPDDPPQQLGAVQIICPVKWIEFKEKNVFNHVKWIQSCRKHVSCRLAASVRRYRRRNMSSSTYPREETKRRNAEQEEPPPWGQTRKALRRARRTGGSQAAAARKRCRRPREFAPGGRSPSSTSPWQSRANWKIEMKPMKRERQ